MDDAARTIAGPVFEEKWPVLAILAITCAIGSYASAQEINPITKELIHDLASPNTQDRVDAAVTLGNRAAGTNGSDERAAIPALVKALRDPVGRVRETAAFALGNVGSDGKTVVPALVEASGDKDESVRKKAVSSLGRIHENAELAVPAIMRNLTDERGFVDRDAMGAMIAFGAEARIAVPDLMVLMKSKSPSARWGAAQILAAIGPDAREAAPLLSAALEDQKGDVRLESAAALASIGVNLGEAIKVPLHFVNDVDEDDRYLRVRAAGVLGDFGAAAEVAIPALTKARAEDDSNLRRVASHALERINRAVEEQHAKNPPKELAPAPVGAAQPVDRARRNSVADRLLGLVRRQPKASAAFLIYLLIASVWLVLFRFAPTALLRVNNVLSPLPKIKLPGWLGGFQISLSHFTLLGFLAYRDRVLQAWVAQHAEESREGFATIETVKAVAKLPEIPVVFDGKERPALRVEDLRPTFRKPRACVVICGEEKASRTRLACQIGRWAMNPAKRLRNGLMLSVFIDEDFIYKSGKEMEPLIKTVRDKLGVQGPPPSLELVAHLLDKQHVLVIIDGLSDLSAETRSLVRPDSTDFPAHALVVTSRVEERFGGIPRTVIRLREFNVANRVEN